MKKILKTAAVLSVLIVAISACQQQGDVSKMLENEESRNQLYETIISDNEHSKQLMQAMMEDDHTLMMMKDRPNVMGQMMDMMHNEGMMDKETMMRNREKMGIENHGDHH